MDATEEEELRPVIELEEKPVFVFLLLTTFNKMSNYLFLYLKFSVV